MLSKKDATRQKPLKQKLMQQSRNAQWQRSPKAKKWREDRAKTPEYKENQKKWRDDNPDKIKEYNKTYQEKRLKLKKEQRKEVFDSISHEASESIKNTNLPEVEKSHLHGYMGDLIKYLEEHNSTWSVRGAQRAWFYYIVPMEFLYIGYEGLFIPRMFGEALSRLPISDANPDQSKPTRYETDDKLDMRNRVQKKLGT